MPEDLFNYSNVVHTSFMRSGAEAVQAAKMRIPIYRDAYEGMYAIYLPKKVQDELAGRLGIKRNLCASVVDAMVSKLDLKSYSVSDENAQKILTAEYAYNHMDIQSTRTHRMTAIDGDEYAMAWPEYDEQGKRTGHTFVRMLNSQDVDMVYSSTDILRPLRCTRQWNVQQDSGQIIVRRDIMTASTIHRQYSQAGSPLWLDWTQDNLPAIIGNSLGVVPVVHFINKIGAGPFGMSELENAIPIQQDINRLVQDAMIRSYFNGGQQVALAGVDRNEFKARNPKGLSREAWSAWMFENPDVKLTVLPPQIMSDMWNSVTECIGHMAIVTRTPMSYLYPKATPSGVAIQEMDGPLIDKVYEAQTVLGDSWQQLFSLMLRIQTGEDIPVHVEWEDPFTASSVDTDLKLYTAGAISQAELLRRQGLNDEQAQKIIAERREEQKSAATTVFGLQGGGA